MPEPITMGELNGRDEAGFVAAIGHAFEHSPWIAAATWPARPFADLAALHAALCATVGASGQERQLALIRAHPDLAGRMARAGQLGADSTQEQLAAGLDALSPDEAAQFDAFNTTYRTRFGFPFVICAREHKKAAILAAFPARLANTREQEIAVALDEIAKIAWLRLQDAVTE
ncbi:2-oxo-4-hydroxy-4-carboxy-5-ureidoimidazoline decarboxylase [Oscillochloris sp. ZM17-4]|uniref:2-oxo-4-hydroxy-4-carboxy-5-ureidoimidazoline decarboxylase n=1 Tax=Oscillochloris sp. ZM17-4 TaxID=2866714 RepID=UPI001C73DA6C|nr:2-oxo-4-hydroxy-4-carboxy-5-ureidoimidazoline decarboxylase [Oscillochloris sp. ZM17-4]MBX0328525.1 2-oxo-4-hydroxy-4-carboxy-5-ureidoimidazoline decarboxylase [Oscillochloris sp. ZM17-4]